MRKLDIFNEVLRRLDEPIVTATNQHPGVIKMNDWWKEVGRQLTDVYEIPEATRIENYNLVTGQTDVLQGMQYLDLAQGGIYGWSSQRVMEVYEGSSRLNGPIDALDLYRAAKLSPSTTLPFGGGGGFVPREWGISSQVGSTTTGEGNGQVIVMWPPVPSGNPTFQVVVRRNLMAPSAGELDTDFCAYPSHLVILGLLYHFKEDRYGPDDPRTTQAQAAYAAAVASHVSFSVTTGSRGDQWEPV